MQQVSIYNGTLKIRTKSIWENWTPTPVSSSGLPIILGDRPVGSKSLPVKSSSDSSNDEAEDNPAEEELESFLWNRKGAGEPPQPLSEQGEYSSGCRSSEKPPMLKVKSLMCGLSWPGSKSSWVTISFGIILGNGFEACCSASPPSPPPDTGGCDCDVLLVIYVWLKETRNWSLLTLKSLVRSGTGSHFPPKRCLESRHLLLTLFPCPTARRNTHGFPRVTLLSLFCPLRESELSKLVSWLRSIAFSVARWLPEELAFKICFCVSCNLTSTEVFPSLKSSCQHFWTDCSSLVFIGFSSNRSAVCVEEKPRACVELASAALLQPREELLLLLDDDWPILRTVQFTRAAL